jgi:tetratricopeptide (TPR) repeat protein
LGLGKCHDQGKKRDQAIEILEDAFDSASTLDNKEQRTEMVRLIGKELIEIYIEKAEELVKIDLAYALKAFESGLVVAQRASERESEARISHKIGELYYLEGQFERSV